MNNIILILKQNNGETYQPAPRLKCHLVYWGEMEAQERWGGNKSKIRTQAVSYPTQGFFLCPTLLICMSPAVQVIGILFKVNTIPDSCFNMFPKMGCLVIGGVCALAQGSHLVCELFTLPPVSMAGIANQSQHSSLPEPRSGPRLSAQGPREPFSIDWRLPHETKLIPVS